MMLAVSPRKRRQGFTLAELAVVIALFGLFSTTALASLSLTLRHWKTISVQTDVYNSCRNAMNCMARELRQAMPNAAPGFENYYIEDPTEPSTQLGAVLTPNQNKTSSEQLTFMEANPTYFRPAEAGFDKTRPELYRKVRYYVQDSKELIREVTTYSSSGTGDTPKKGVVAKGDDISLLVTCSGASIYHLTFTCRKGYGDDIKEASLSTTVIVMGK